MKLIVVAMKEECDALMNFLNLKQVGINEYANDKFALVCCGIGKVNAAMGCQYGISKYKPELVINYGFVGSMSPNYKVTDFVFPEIVMQHDFDLTVFGLKPNEVSGQEKSEFNLVGFEKLKSIIPNLKKCSYLLTGDKFMTEKLPGFEDAICDMEGYAIARVAYNSNIPCSMVKFVSDSCNKEGADTFNNSVEEYKTKMQKYVAESLLN